MIITFEHLRKKKYFPKEIEKILFKNSKWKSSYNKTFMESTYEVIANMSFWKLESITIKEKFGSATHNAYDLSSEQISKACIEYAIKNNFI